MAKMTLETRHFGTIDFEEERILRFADGLVGFEADKRFLFIENEDQELPFHWLQSIDNPELAFVVVNPMAIRPDYEFEISDAVEKRLEIEDPNVLAILAIVVIPADIDKMTMNLLAPLVINSEKRVGEQVVLVDDRYTTRHLVSAELERSTKLISEQATPGTTAPSK